jgi:hypothetical protein
LQHLIQVVDSYLIAKGHRIEHKEVPSTSSGCQDYLKGQLKKLKQYL